MVTLYRVVLATEALDAFSLTQSENEKHYIAAVDDSIWQPWKIDYCLLGFITCGPMQNRLLCLYKSERVIETIQPDELIRFRAYRDKYLQRDRIYEISNVLSHDSITLGVGFAKDGLTNLLGFKEVQAETLSFKVKPSKRKRLILDVQVKDRTLKRGAVAKALEVWANEFASSFVRIVTDNQRGDNDGFVRKFQIYDFQKRSYKSIRTMQEFIDLVNDHTSRDFYKDMADDVCHLITLLNDDDFIDKSSSSSSASASSAAASSSAAAFSAASSASNSAPPPILFDATI